MGPSRETVHCALPVLECLIADLQQDWIGISTNVVKFRAIRRNLHEAIECDNVHAVPQRRHDTCHQREALFTADSRKAQAHEDGRKDAKLPLDLDHPQRTPGIPGVVVTFEHKA